MNLVIWNKTNVENIDIVMTDENIIITVGKVNYKTIPMKENGIEIYNNILDRLEEINQEYIKGNEEKFQELSDKILEEIKLM